MGGTWQSMPLAQTIRLLSLSTKPRSNLCHRGYRIDVRIGKRATLSTGYFVGLDPYPGLLFQRHPTSVVLAELCTLGE